MTSLPILVGVDGSEPSLAAIDLAIREGALRDCAVRIVHGDPWANHPAWANNDPAADPLSEPQQAIRAATDRAAGNQVPVTAEILAGDPAAVLIGESAHADLLVLGHRGRGGLPGLLLGSVAIKVAALAACPVMITRDIAPVTGDILVGVDGSAADDAVLGFAFQEAALRGAGLRALHARSRTHVGDPESLLREATEPDGAVLTWSRKYPGVTVHQEVTTGRPADAIVEAGADAQLVVLGARGQARLPGRRLGSVSHAVLHHTACPVAIVR